MYLYHYFDKRKIPFLNLSDLTDEEAIKLHTNLSAENNERNIFAERDANGQYMIQRRIVEKRAYSMFVRKGGKLSCIPTIDNLETYAKIVEADLPTNNTKAEKKEN